MSCGIGLGRVLFFLLGLLGLFFFLCLLGKRAVLQGKVGIGDIHHQITGTGTVAAVLNGDANGDLRIVRRQVSHHHSVQIVLARGIGLAALGRTGLAGDGHRIA